MIKSRWALLFVALTVFLTACPGPGPDPDPAAISLAVSPTSLPTAGGEVTLTVTVDSGVVTEVDFLADGASVGKDSDGSDGFSVKHTVSANTATTAKTIKYVATGTTDTGTVNSNEVNLTQAGAPAPGTSVAPSKTINTVAGVPTVSGKAATGLQAVAAEVTGIQGTVTPEASKATSKGTVVIEQSAANKLQFVYTPSASATGTDTFQYTVRNGTAAPATGTITLNLAKKVLAPVANTSITDINAATTNEVVVIAGTGNIACSADPCINLEAGQVILGNGTATIGDVTLTNAAAKRTIVVNLPIPTAPTTTSSTVVRLANDVTIQGLNIASDATNTGSIYEAFAGDTVTGAVTIKDIAVDMGTSTRNAIRIGAETPTDRNNAIVLENVTIASQTNERIGIDIKSASAVTVKNTAPAVTVTFDPVVAPANANIGISITGVSTTIILDGAAVTSSAFDGTPADTSDAPQAPAFNIFRLAGAGEMKLTAKNTRTTVGASGTAFHLTGAGGPIAVQADSTGNTITPATATKVIKTGTSGTTSTGTIVFTN